MEKSTAKENIQKSRSLRKWVRRMLGASLVFASAITPSHVHAEKPGIPQLTDQQITTLYDKYFDKTDDNQLDGRFITVDKAFTQQMYDQETRHIQIINNWLRELTGKGKQDVYKVTDPNRFLFSKKPQVQRVHFDSNSLQEIDYSPWPGITVNINPDKSIPVFNQPTIISHSHLDVIGDFSDTKHAEYKYTYEKAIITYYNPVQIQALYATRVFSGIKNLVSYYILYKGKRLKPPFTVVRKGNNSPLEFISDSFYELTNLKGNSVGVDNQPTTTPVFVMDESLKNPSF